MHHVRHQTALTGNVLDPNAGGDRPVHSDMENLQMLPRKLPPNIVLWAPAIAIALVLAIWALGAIDFLFSQ